MPLFQSHKEYSTVVLDIGSGSVRTLLLRSSQGGVPECVSLTHASFYPRDDSPHTLEKKMLSAVSTLLRQIPPIGVVEHCIVSVSSPWIRARVSHHKESHNEKFLFNADKAEAILAEERGKFKADLESIYGEKHIVVDAEMSHLSLDGYPVSWPVSKESKHAELTLYQCAVSEHIYRSLEREIGKHFTPRSGMRIVSPVHVLKGELPKVIKSSGKTAILHVTEFGTDGLLFQGGKLSESISLPYGARSVGSTLSQELGMSPEVADSLLSLFVKGLLDEGLRQGVDKLVTKSEDEWQKLCHEVKLGEVGKIVYLASEKDERVVKALLRGLSPSLKLVSLVDERLFRRQLPHAERETLGEDLALLSILANSLLQKK